MWLNSSNEIENVDQMLQVANDELFEIPQSPIRKKARGLLDFFNETLSEKENEAANSNQNS